MTGNELLEILKRHDGFITNSHIVYTSGKHGQVYLNKDAIYPYTQDISEICLEIAKRFKNKNIQIVAAPALGGIILSQWTAFHLSKLTGNSVLGVYTEKTVDKNQIFTRGYDKLVKDKKVLVVEDITTTGGSVKKVISSVKNAGGQVVAVCVLANRDPVNINSVSMGAPFEALAEIEIAAWDEKDCPMCKKNIPINTTVGKGREYLEKKNK
jgi:orotate phosphoribosyltransferase